MICDECGQSQAIFHSMKIINGTKSERHLCASCQSKVSNRVAAAKNLAELFSSFNALSGTSTPPVKREIKLCQNCGIGLTQVLKDGYLGCPVCYEAFGDVLLPMIAKVQNGTRHKGKSPHAARAKSARELEIEHLRGELKIAADSERYEEAAAIQSKIRALLGDDKA